MTDRSSIQHQLKPELHHYCFLRKTKVGQIGDEKNRCVFMNLHARKKATKAHVFA